jgi:hypothetical protein
LESASFTSNGNGFAGFVFVESRTLFPGPALTVDELSELELLLLLALLLLFSGGIREDKVEGDEEFEEGSRGLEERTSSLLFKLDPSKVVVGGLLE